MLGFKIYSARHLSLGVIVVSVGALVSAFAAQYGFGLEPCILCTYQRVPFAINIIFGLLAFFLVSRNNMQLWLLCLSGLIFFVGACIAFYHVGVEQHWWQSAASCGGKPITSAITPDQLFNSLQRAQPKACDDIDWGLFGITMASYNLVFSLVLAILTLVGVQKMEKSK